MSALYCPKCGEELHQAYKTPGAQFPYSVPMTYERGNRSVEFDHAIGSLFCLHCYRRIVKTMEETR
jgi:hypothetical protein